eukprot:243830_1
MHLNFMHMYILLIFAFENSIYPATYPPSYPISNPNVVSLNDNSTIATCDDCKIANKSHLLQYDLNAKTYNKALGNLYGISLHKKNIRKHTYIASNYQNNGMNKFNLMDDNYFHNS